MNYPYKFAILLLLITPFTIFAQQPDIIVQTGHVGAVNSIAFSPDGRLVASQSSDQTIKLWDVASGNEIRSLVGHSMGIASLTFSPDGKLLAGVSGTNVKIWDVASGNETRSLETKAKLLECVAFSPDGKVLAISGWPGLISLWDFANDRFKWRDADAEVHSIAFSPDGTLLAFGGENGNLKLWQVKTGNEIRSFAGHSDTVWSVSFSRDGKLLTSGGKDKTVRLWDVMNGKQIWSVAGHSESVRSATFSPDGKLIATGSADKTVKLWDVASGKQIRSLDGHSESVGAVAFSPNGEVLASGSADATVKFWDPLTGKNFRSLESRTSKVTSVAFSPDGRLLATGSRDRIIRLWDIVSGNGIRSLVGHSNSVNSVAFNRDGKLLVSGSGDKTIKLWDVSTGKEIRSLVGHSGSVNSIALSNDGKLLASGSADETFKLWDVGTGKEVRSIGSQTIDRVSRDPVSFSVGFSPDSQLLASTYFPGSKISLWNVITGSEIRSFEHALVFSAAFSPDGKILATAGDDGNIKLWEVSTGKEIRSLASHSHAVFAVVFSPDGKMLAGGTDDGNIKLWDINSGNEIRSLSGRTSVTSMAFSPDGRILASVIGGVKINLWEASTGEELASLVAINEQDWVVVTPDGLFDGSPSAWHQILWRFGNTFDFAPVEAYFNDFFHPGLLQDVFAGKRPRPPAGKDVTKIDRRRPSVKLMLEDKPEAPGATVSKPTLAGRNITLKVEITDNTDKTAAGVTSTRPTGGAQDVRLFRNGSLVKVWRGDVLQSKSSFTLETTIPIVAGENRLTAYAFNHDNIKSSDATLTITGDDSLKRKSFAYVLAVGVNEYSNSQYNLKYAVADALDFADELKRQQEKLGKYEHVEVIALNDKGASKVDILRSLTNLSRRTQPEDAVFIYFAGHGTAQKDRFYLIPHDLGYMGSRKNLTAEGLETILSHSISDLELEESLRGIDAGQLVLIIDACNSGQALEAEEKRRGPMNSKGLAQLAYEKGMYILTAAQSYQAAQEASRLGHGFLTYALVEEGLKSDAADKNPKDGQVLLREWLDFATARVPEMQREKVEEQKKQRRQLEQIIVFAEGDKGRDQRLQRPRVFYRREAEVSPLVVARP